MMLQFDCSIMIDTVPLPDVMILGVVRCRSLESSINLRTKLPSHGMRCYPMVPNLEIRNRNVTNCDAPET